LFQTEAKSNKPLGLEEKKAWLERLENKSKREAEQVILKTSAHTIKPDQVKAISNEHSVVQFTATHELLDKIERLKGLLAHSHPNLSLAELMSKLCDLGLEKFDPGRAPKRKSPPAPARVKQPKPDQRLAIPRIVPVSWGGADELSNLTLLCRKCNQRTAIEKMGQTKMDLYINAKKPVTASLRPG
jgi:hypothetical protein